MKEPFNSLVSIIICNHNGAPQLNKLFLSFTSCCFYQNYEIIVVDNASTDDSISFLENQKVNCSIKIICNDKNETFSKASNQGAEIARGEYLLFLHNDIEVTDYWLDELLKVAQIHKNAGTIGAKLVCPEIPEHMINFGKDFKIQHTGIAFHRRYFEGKQFIYPYNKGNGEDTFIINDDNKTIPVAGVTGACLLIQKEVFENIGGFDEHYVCGYEDVDLNLKTLRKGYTNYYCPTAVLFHYEFGTQQNNVKQEVALRSKSDLMYFSRRWHSFLKREILLDKIAGTQTFTEDPFTITFVLQRNSILKEDDPKVEKFVSEMTAKGYNVKCLYQDDCDWYNIGDDTDIIISMSPVYDLRKIKTKDAGIISFALIMEGTEYWCNSESFPYYTFVLAETEAECWEIFQNSKRNAFLFEKKATQLVHLLTMYCCQFERKIVVLMPVPNQKAAESWGDYHFGVALKKCFENRGYDAEMRFFLEWDRPFDGKYVLVLRGLRKYIPKMEHFNIMWNISHPDDVEIREYNTYDINFISSEIWAARLKSKVRMPVIPLLQCTDTDVFTGEQDQKGEKTQVLFVGNTRGVFRDVIRNSIPADYQVSVYGQGWEKFIESKYIKGIVIPNKDLNSYYSNCDILLNDHWEDMKEKGFVSNRIYDGLAAGAFIITDKVKGMDPELRQCVAIYENGEDLRKKIDYYLQHPELRKSMASKGQEIVRNKHTFQQRVDSVIQSLKNCNEKNNVF